mgnify:CR=1 FL=1
MTQIDGYAHEVARLGAENGPPFIVGRRSQARREAAARGGVGGGYNLARPKV